MIGHRLTNLGLLVGLLACQIGCSGEPVSLAVESFTVRDSAGIEIVSSLQPLWDDGQVWQIDDNPLLEIGLLEGDPHKMFTIPWPTRLSDGRILVAELVERELRMFTPQGEWLWTYGREGEGPGEFKYIDRFTVLPGDTILVFDRGNRRATRVDPSGQFIDSVPIPSDDLVSINVGVLSQGTWLFRNGLMTPDSAGLNRSHTEIALLSSDGKVKTVLDTLTMDVYMSESRGTSRGSSMMMVPLPFQARPSFAAGHGFAYVTGASMWQVDVYDSTGELKRFVRRAWTPEAVTDADIEARIGFQREVQKEWNTSESQNESGIRLLAEAARLTVAKPALSRISVDRAGNLWTLDWALPNRPSPDQQYDVFRPDGVWLGSVELSAGMRLAEAGDDYVLVIVEDEIGIRRVRLHELVKPDRPRQDS